MFDQSGSFDMFVQNWNTDARWYADFRFQPYLNLINIEKNRVALSSL